MSSKYFKKRHNAVACRTHYKSRHHNSGGNRQKCLFKTHFHKCGNKGACPAAGARQGHCNKQKQTYKRIFINLITALLSLFQKKIRNLPEKAIFDTLIYSIIFLMNIKINGTGKILPITLIKRTVVR